MPVQGRSHKDQMQNYITPTHVDMMLEVFTSCLTVYFLSMAFADSIFLYFLQNLVKIEVANVNLCIEYWP